MPWKISAVDAELLETALEQFIAAYTDHIKNDGLAVDFENGGVLYRRYVPETKSWTTRPEGKVSIKITVEQYIIDDEPFIAALQAKKSNGRQLEADALYFPIPLEKGGKEAPFLMRTALLADTGNGMIAAQRLLAPGEDCADCMIDLLEDCIKNHGRPKALLVRDRWAALVYMDFCEKTGIDLICDEGVPIIDEAADDMLEHFGAF